MRRQLALVAGFVMGVMLPSAAHALTVGGADIVPSTALVPLASFPLTQIHDGITSDNPFNGFGSASPSGVITLDLVGEFDLTKFLLWNDINVFLEGIKDFRLDFFDSLDMAIAVGFDPTYVGPQGQLAVAEYVFDDVVPGVSRVDLVVLSSHVGVATQIEIREVAFEAVPELSVSHALALTASTLLGLRRLARLRSLRG